MSQDVFIERIVKRGPDAKSAILMVFIIIAAVIVCAAFILIPMLIPFFPIALVACACTVYFLIKNQDVEFEYAVTNGEMDIDKIVGKSRRKRLMTVDCRRFDILAPYTDEFKRTRSRAEKVFDYSRGGDNSESYFAMFRDGEKNIMLVFDPDDRMLEAFRVYIPSKLTKSV